MQVIYNNESFNSVVKACILKEIKGYVPVREAGIDAITKTDDYNLNELFIEWDWMYGTPHNISGLEGAVSLALRYKFSNQELIFNVIKQALMNGIDYVLTRKSYESKRFCNQVYAVRNELRSAKLGMRFTHDGELLLGKYMFTHDIANLLLDFYQKRFPLKKVVIMNNEHAYSTSGIMAMPVPVNAQAGQFSVPASLSPSQSMSLTAFM